MMKSFYSLILMGLLGLSSCKVDPVIIPVLPVNDLREIVPQGWPAAKYTFSVNAISAEAFVLGRSLFYETLLSKDNTISCASCHMNKAAFSNPDHNLSHGINGILGKRNAPGIFNLTWHPYFMHDGGINHIEVQPLGPISNRIEMAENINNVISKLQGTDKYKTLFKNAFGTEEVTTQRMFRAMAQFMGLIYSYNSKYDKVIRNEEGMVFTEAESRGYALFQANCNACHKEPLFTDFQFRNNGMRVDPQVNDSGRAHITNQAIDLYKFKTPSLRNLAHTYPYMHDGSLATLQACLDHYTSGVVNITNLDPYLQSGGLKLSAEDKKDLIAFLLTLTDNTIASDSRFADPNIK